MRTIFVIIIILCIAMPIYILAYFAPGRLLTDYPSSNITTLDDVSPYNVNTTALESFLQKHSNESIVIFVTPFYADVTNLSDNKNWTNAVLDLQRKYNFTIGLHGYNHRFLDSQCNEFMFPNPDRIYLAMEEFKRGFGYYPTVFRAPCFDLDVFDYIFIEDVGMNNYGWLGKGAVYHPSDL